MKKVYKDIDSFKGFWYGWIWILIISMTKEPEIMSVKYFLKEYFKELESQVDVYLFLLSYQDKWMKIENDTIRILDYISYNERD